MSSLFLTSLKELQTQSPPRHATTTINHNDPNPAMIDIAFTGGATAAVRNRRDQ